MTLSRKGLFGTLSINDTKAHSVTSAIILSVTIYFVMLSVVMLSVVMLSAVAPVKISYTEY